MTKYFNVALIKKIFRLIYQKETLLFFNTDYSDYSSRLGNKDYSDLTVELSDWNDYMKHASQHHWLGSRKEMAEKRLATGDQLYLAKRGGEIVHIIWVRVSDLLEATYELGPMAKIKLDSPLPIFYDAWTPESARGQGIYPKVLEQIILRLHEKYQTVWIYCSDQNFASRKGAEKAGFQFTMAMTTLRICKIPLRMWIKEA